MKKMATAKAEAISQHNFPHYLLGRWYFSFMPRRICGIYCYATPFDRLKTISFLTNVARKDKDKHKRTQCHANPCNTTQSDGFQPLREYVFKLDFKTNTGKCC